MNPDDDHPLDRAWREIITAMATASDAERDDLRRRLQDLEDAAADLIAAEDRQRAEDFDAYPWRSPRSGT